eukprot:1157892-Pelagomonas_calceolata.AAC.3
MHALPTLPPPLSGAHPPAAGSLAQAPPHVFYPPLSLALGFDIVRKCTMARSSAAGGGGRGYPGICPCKELLFRACGSLKAAVSRKQGSAPWLSVCCRGWQRRRLPGQSSSRRAECRRQGRRPVHRWAGIEPPLSFAVTIGVEAHLFRRKLQNRKQMRKERPCRQQMCQPLHASVGGPDR